MSKIVQLLTHPSELKSVVQLLYFREKQFPRDKAHESKTLTRCYELLFQTSRSFSAVIEELHPELRDAVCLFYMVLRALDTVEDDMTLDPKVKVPILRAFDQYLDTDDWSFNDSGPNEKDRDVLVEYPVILAEYHKLKPEYQAVVKDITYKMGNGMADYILDEQFNLDGVQTVEDFDLYCFYVAGLVGEGLTSLMSLAKFADPTLTERKNLIKSMGLFLQKTNLIRDFAEDLEDGRSFWPKEIWGKYADKLTDFTEAKNLEAGLHCISDLVLNSLDHAVDVLTYLSLVHEETCFNFCAIPQVMAIATLTLVYQNPDLFTKHVKIRRGTTCSLILKSRTLEGVVEIFRYYTRQLNHKSNPNDPNYLKIGIMCGRIEQLCESMYPNLEHLPAGLNPDEAFGKVQIYQNVKERQHVDDKMKKIIGQETFKCNLTLFSVGFVVFALFGYFFTGSNVSVGHVDL